MTLRELVEMVHSDISDLDAPADFLLVGEQIRKERTMDKPVIEQKPTLDQIAWVFKCLMLAWSEGVSYRNLLYDVMGLDESSYAPLQLSGALEINNLLFEDHERRHTEDK